MVAVSGAAWVQGLVWPLGGSVGPVGVASVGGMLACGWGDAAVRCASVDRASRGWPQWQAGTARFVVAPDRRWAPSSSTVTMTVGTVATGARVLWVPMWWMAAGGALLVGAGAALGRRRVSGECPSCGYSRSGLTGGAACPECGAGEEAKEARC
ncbi:MAG: hypothetical protein DYG92_09990 [Leptolyngbya sp. PLA1]|nr:hypothetical protein [Leptolyngbya sp. PLA1]